MASSGHLLEDLCSPDTSLSELDGRPLIVFPQGGRPSFADHVLNILGRECVTPSALTMAEDVFVALAMTMVSDAYCVVPESVALLNWPQLQFRRIDDERVSAPVNCLFLKENRPPVVEAFLKCIAAVIHTDSVSLLP